MATMKRNTKKQETKQAPERVAHTYSVSRVKEFKNGGIAFDLNIDDITIYGCHVVESKNGDFISFPSKQGKDGRYYSHVYIRLTEDETSEILDKVSEALAEQ